MKNLLLILTFLLVSCGSDSDSVSPYGPETLIGNWELQKLEYRTYFARAVLPGEVDRVVTLDEPIEYNPPTVSGTASFDGNSLSIEVLMTTIKVTSVTSLYTAENGVIEITLGKDQKINWGFNFTEGSLVLFIPDLPGSDIMESRLYYTKK